MLFRIVIPFRSSLQRLVSKQKNFPYHISVEVHTIYKTGVEVEAMHGASIVALTIYDMLKPLDKGIEIVIDKTGEKIGR